MKSQARAWLMTSALLGIWGLAVGCEGDPPKRASFDGDAGAGGEGGDPGNGSGGSKAPSAGQPGEAGAPSEGGMPNPGTAGMPSGAGGMPSEQGGMPSTAGMPNEPTAGAPNLGACEGELSFADPYVEQQVLDALGLQNGPVTAAQVASLTQLAIPFNDDNIDMTGIECLTALVTLDFSGGGGGSPLELLAQLPNLRSIDFNDGYLSDLTGLEQVTQLTSLDLSRNPLTQVGPLASLVNLENLNLFGIGDFNFTPVDISSLEPLSKLKTLNLGYVIIEDSSPLASLPQLEELVLANATLTDTPPFASLPNLTALDLQGQDLTAIPNLSAQTKLQALTLDYNAIADFSPLSSLTLLTELHLKYTGLSSLTALTALTALTTLDVSNNALTDVTVLGALPALSVLDISTNPIASLQPLVDSSYIAAGDDITAYAVDCTANGAAMSVLIARSVTVSNSCGL